MKPAEYRDGDAPLVSVVMPVFNGERFIGEALDSVFAQTYHRFEVIVVDDGSTDGTLDIVATYGDRLRVFRQQNKGNATARNRGVEMARGEWTAQLDADDWWDATKLEKQARYLDGADVIYTAALNFGDSSRVEDITFANADCPEGDVFDELIMANFVPHSSVLMRTCLVRQIGGYDETLRSIVDWDLLLRLSGAGARFAACCEPLTHYRWRAASVSRNHRRTSEDRLSVVERALDSPRGRLVSTTRKRRAVADVWRTSAWFAAEQDNWTAVRWYARAIAIWPFSVSGWRELLRATLHLFGISRERLLN